MKQVGCSDAEGSSGPSGQNVPMKIYKSNWKSRVATRKRACHTQTWALLLNCSASTQVDNEIGTETNRRRQMNKSGMITLSWLTCIHSSAMAASDLLIPLWTMKLCQWQIHWQIGLQEELHLCLSPPGTRACSSHTGHVSRLLLLSTNSWLCQPNTVSITQPDSWQDNSALQCFSWGYEEGISGQNESWWAKCDYRASYTNHCTEV